MPDFAFKWHQIASFFQNFPGGEPPSYSRAPSVNPATTNPENVPQHPSHTPTALLHMQDEW